MSAREQNAEDLQDELIAHRSSCKFEPCRKGSERCPAAESIALDIDRRAARAFRDIPNTNTVLLCQARPRSFELDFPEHGACPTADEWLSAQEACRRCPLLDECRWIRDRNIEAGRPPRAQIAAGDAYNDHGDLLTPKGLRRRQSDLSKTRTPRRSSSPRRDHAAARRLAAAL